MKNTKKKGFTLVELVIVIAVIAILAAVLIPTFSNVIERANQSKALQAARIAFENYLLELDYTDEDDVEASTADYIIVESGYAFLVEDGSLSSTAYKATTEGTTLTLKYEDTTKTYTVGNVNTSTNGSYATPVTNYNGFYTLTVIDND